MVSHFQLSLCKKIDKCVGPSPFKCYDCGSSSSSSTQSGGECFPATAKVTLDSGKSVKMSELQIGDQVQTGMKSVTLDILYSDRGPSANRYACGYLKVINEFLIFKQNSNEQQGRQ